jgi:dipeptidyl aminopeptidase/acylaminoacyl peptidase
LMPIAVPGNVSEVSWSPDGTRLAVLTRPPHNLGDLAPANQVWLVPLDSPLNVEALPECAPTASGLTWDGSGKRLYFNAQSRHTALPVYPTLYMDDLDTHQVRDIAVDVDGTLLGTMLSYGDDGVVVPVLKGLTWEAMSFNASGRSTVLQSFPGTITGLTANSSRSTWAALFSRSGYPPELRVGRDPARLTHTPAIPSFYSTGARRSAVAQHVEWHFSGRTLQGLLYLPPEQKGRAAPLIVEAHGGPSDAYSDSDAAFVDFLAGQGWAVLRPNPRGSNGRGAEFAAANRRDLGGGDLDDILAGVDAVLKNASLDGNRLAFIGYSYGGELGAFLEGRTPRFKAIVSGGPVTDQFSEYGTEIDSSYDRWFVGFPWQEFDVARRQSPLAAIGRETKGTPMLLLQAQNDIADPPGQSYELYRALRQQHIPVDLVTYPRDDHWSLENGINGEPVTEPWHGFDARQRISDFLHKELDSRE